MDSYNYITQHDFGYGKETEIINLNKLELRNLKDLETYINWSLKELFFANIDNKNIITFFNNKSKIKINIKLIS